MTALNINHKPEDWRLFIDLSKSSLKAVLLHNGNVLPSIPAGYAVNMKESYDNMELLLNCVNYKKYQRQLCGDLKVVAVLVGLQQGYTKLCCFLCEWGSRENTSHCKRRDWPSRQSLEPGTKNFQHLPLVESSNILLPPLHIKLGPMMNFVKAMDQTGPAFRYLAEKLPGISAAKIKEGVFIGPLIRKLFRDEQFDHILSGNEKRAWNDFRLVATNFLGKNKADNYKELVENLLLSYEELGCSMSLKIHFLHSYLDFSRKVVGH
jgi:hypothetical protein